MGNTKSYSPTPKPKPPVVYVPITTLPEYKFPSELAVETCHRGIYTYENFILKRYVYFDLSDVNKRLQQIELVNQALKKLNPKYFIRYQWFCYNQSDLWVCQEKALGITLWEWSRTLHSRDEYRTILSNILLALIELEKINVYHLDISYSNILVDKDLNIKIIDYDTMSNEFHLKKITSTFPAPEIEWINRNHYERDVFKRTFLDKADVFALGMIYYIMLTNSVPYTASRTADYFRLRDNFCLFPANVTEWKPIPFVYQSDPLIESLVNIMIKPVPSERKSASEIYDLLSGGMSE
jgi:serine/threonine protein kinase